MTRALLFAFLLTACAPLDVRTLKAENALLREELRICRRYLNECAQECKP